MRREAHVDSPEAKNALREFLTKYVDAFGKRPGSLQRSSSATDWQIVARQSLGYALEELTKADVPNLINTVGHLKRATDWQLEQFLQYYNLNPRHANLSVPKKLQFLQDAGASSPYVLLRDSMKCGTVWSTISSHPVYSI